MDGKSHGNGEHDILGSGLGGSGRRSYRGDDVEGSLCLFLSRAFIDGGGSGSRHGSMEAEGSEQCPKSVRSIRKRKGPN